MTQIIRVSKTERDEAGDRYGDYLHARGYSWDRLTRFYRDGKTGDLVYELRVG